MYIRYFANRSTLNEALFLGLLVVIGLVVRLDFLIASDFRMDSDEAIVGLMAKHFLDGHSLPTFYYGQAYMGSFEALMAALSFALFGVSEAALKLVPLVFSLTLIPLVYLLGRSLSGVWAGRAAGLLAALPPSTLIIWSTKARGGFIEIVVLGAVALLVTIWWLRKTEASRSGIALLGLLLGLGWWINNQIIFFMLPIGLFVLMSSIGRWRRGKLTPQQFAGLFGIGFLAFLFGGVLFWAHNLTNSFESFGMFGPAAVEDLGSQIVKVFTLALPILLGAKRYWHTEDVFLLSTFIVWMVYGGLLFYILFARSRALNGLLRGVVDSHRPVELMLVFVVATLATFAFSSHGYLSEAPRYLLPLYVGVFPLVGFALELLRVRKPIVAAALLGVILVINLSSAYLWGRSVPGEPFVYKGERVSQSHTELIEWLTENDVKWVRTNYWIGYRLAFETKEAVRFIVTHAPHQVRIPSYQTIGLQQDPSTVPLVLVPAQGEVVLGALEALGYQFRTTVRSGYTVVYDLKPCYRGLEPLTLVAEEVRASSNQELAPLALDNRVDTRWGSGQPQTPGMEFEITLVEGVRASALRVDLGSWAHDYPRGLRLTIIDPVGRKTRLFGAKQYEQIRYFLESSSQFTVCFPEQQVRGIFLTQLGQHKVFDWTIAEVGLLAKRSVWDE